MGNKSKRGPKKKGIDKNNEIKKTIEENNIAREINKSDQFWKDNPELNPIYMSPNKYMFYLSADGRTIYKVCQRGLYEDADLFISKKEELLQQIRDIEKNYLKEALVEIKEKKITDDLVWYSMKTLRNIRELFNPDNNKYYEWKEVVPFVQTFMVNFEKNFIKNAKSLFDRCIDYDLDDSFRFEEYINYINGLLSGFKLVLSPTIPEKLKAVKGLFPKETYRINKNLTTENMCLNEKLEITLLDPVYIEESLPYLFAEFELIADNIDNELWSKYSRWTKFIKEYFKPMLDNNKNINKYTDETRQFYRAVRLIEKSYLFLLRDHDVALDCLQQAMCIFADLEVGVLNLGIFDKNFNLKKPIK